MRLQIMRNASIQNVSYQYLAKIFFGIIALFASAQITIPMKPVAVTLHTMIVMIIGLTYSRKEAIPTITTYILLGALGMPFFGHMNSGLAYLFGPVGGYYLGMFLAISTMSYAKEKFELSNLLNCILGQSLIYIPGVLWLSQFIGLEASITNGFLVFIPSGTIKVILLVSILKYLKK